MTTTRRRPRPNRSTRYFAALATVERTMLAGALRRAGGSVKRAAAALGLPLSTMKYKLRRFKVRKPHGRTRRS
jgi:DNA-binding NtrC family response regulator